MLLFHYFWGSGSLSSLKGAICGGLHRGLLQGLLRGILGVLAMAHGKA